MKAFYILTQGGAATVSGDQPVVVTVVSRGVVASPPSVTAGTEPPSSGLSDQEPDGVTAFMPSSS